MKVAMAIKGYSVFTNDERTLYKLFQIMQIANAVYKQAEKRP